MSSEGPRTCGTGADNAGVGTIAWTDVANITASDGSHAAVVLGLLEVSHYLVASNFGFTIPTGASIVGIVVEWEKLTDAGNMVDSRIRIVKGGTVGSTDKASGSNWPAGTPAFVSYGSATDLWGLSWTPTDINASNFGAALAATENGGTTAKIDSCRITVHYQDPVGPRRKQTRTAMYEEHPERKW